MNKTLNQIAADQMEAEKIAEQLRHHYGTDNVYMDAQGNLYDARTHQLLEPITTRDEMKQEAKERCRDFFREQPAAVQKALLQAALAHKIQDAMEQMEAYGKGKDHTELWAASYEELAKLAAEGILLDEG